MKKEKKYIKCGKDKLEFMVYTPEKISQNMPVLLFLHGIGERGNNLELIEKYALPKYLNRMDIPYVVIAPQCLEGNFWDYHLRDIEQILEEEYKRYHYDKNRVCILGCSMGAYGSWNYIIQRPNLFKGIIAVAGGIMLPVKQNLLLIKDKPILIYHGDKDDVVDISESENAYNKLKEVGANNIELKIVKDDNHFLCSHAFKDKYLFEWLERNI